MRFEGQHRTTYRFNKAVFLEPHRIRLRPLEHATQRLLDYRLTINPHPDGLSTYLDSESNPVAEAWFSGLTETLEIVTCFTVDTLRSNPFDFILIDDECASLPAAYPAELQETLVLYRQAEPLPEAVTCLGNCLVQQAGGDTLAFLAQLCSWLYDNIEVMIRPTGEPMPAAETFEKRQGSCRDLTVLFMALCRSQGLAARFVSGYQAGDLDQEHRHLHAWSEVYLPGGGWRGYDPTHGLAVADQHIAVAASWQPSGAAPVFGSIRGDGCVAELDFEIQLTTIT